MSSLEIETNQEITTNQSENPIDNIKSSGIFESDYLDGLKIVTFGDDGASDGVSDIEDFIRGRTTDFVGIYSEADYAKFDPKQADDRHAIALYFRKKPAYDEFVAHEIAHNVFDLEYGKHFGKYEEKDGIPAVSDEYSNKMRNIFSGIILERYPNLEITKFEFNRQQICEIFALLYEREFCKRELINTEAHLAVADNCRTFLDNPEGELLKFNSENGRNCTMEDFYSENHILSLIAAPLIEDKYSDFNDRLTLFWE